MKLKKFQIGGLFKNLASNSPISSDSYIQQAYQQDFVRKNNLPADYFTVSNEQRGQYNEQWKQRALDLEKYKQEEALLKEQKMRRQNAMVPINFGKEPTEAFQEGGKFYEDLPDSEKWDLQYNASMTMPKGWEDPDGWLDKYLKARGIQRRETVSTEDVINAQLGTKISKGIDKINNYLDTRFPVFLKHMSPGFDYAYKQKETKDKKSQETKPQNKKSSSLETPKKKLVQRVPKNQEGAKFGGYIERPDNTRVQHIPNNGEGVYEMTPIGYGDFLPLVGTWRAAQRIDKGEPNANYGDLAMNAVMDLLGAGMIGSVVKAAGKAKRIHNALKASGFKQVGPEPTKFIKMANRTKLSRGYMNPNKYYHINLGPEVIAEKTIPNVDYYNIAMQPMIQSLRVPATYPFK